MSNNHVFISENIILLCFFLITAVLLSQLLEKFNITWMPASGAQIIFGFLVGVVVFLVSPAEADFLMFKSDFFFFALLPPIVFEAGYAMKRTNFFRNVGSIMFFAFIGTAISTFVVGFGLYFLANWGMVDIDPNDALDPLTFGALISSIDPIATLAILGNKQLRCDPLLYSLVFGESVLNDAVAITMYQTFIGFRGQEHFTGRDYWGAMGKFMIITIASIAIGSTVALLCSFLLRKVNFTKHPSNEFIIIFFSAYACYCFAEWTHMSGIMAVFICGVMQAHYAWYNISAVSRTTTRHAFHSFAHIAEALLYVYFGISAFFSTQSHFGFEWSISLIFWSAVLCLLGRALNIFPLAALANLGRKRKIGFKMQIVMWFAGLRGAISFALALSMDSPIPGADKYITTTMVLVVLTTIGMGGSSNWLLGKLGLTGVDIMDEDENPAIPSGATDSDGAKPDTGVVGGYNQMEEETVERGKRKCCKTLNIHRTWTQFDTNYMQPFFGGRHAPRLVDLSAEHEGQTVDNTDLPNQYLHPEIQAAITEVEKQQDAEDEAAVEQELQEAAAARNAIRGSSIASRGSIGSRFSIGNAYDDPFRAQNSSA